MENKGNPVVTFIVNHWVSWVIEIAILSVVAYITIAETRKTAEQTRDMLARFEASVAKYASEKSQKIDAATASGFEATKAKTKAVEEALLKGLLNKLEEEQDKANK